jgi:hypothetical protein
MCRIRGEDKYFVVISDLSLTYYPYLLIAPGQHGFGFVGRSRASYQRATEKSLRNRLDQDSTPWELLGPSDFSVISPHYPSISPAATTIHESMP